MCLHDRLSDDPGTQSRAVLFRQAQAGCRDCLNDLMEQHDGLVHAVVRRQVLGDLPYDEALQAGRIGLWRAILGYDPDRGWAFSTYAWPSITRHVWQAAKAGRESSKAEPLPATSAAETLLPSAGALDPAIGWELSAVHNALYDLVKRLPMRLRHIVIARYGLAGHRTAFYREIAERLHLSGERVRQLHTEALVWLRHPPHSQQLRSLLNRHTLADYEWAEALAQRWLRKRGGRHGRR